jgi:hypothetical protein
MAARGNPKVSGEMSGSARTLPPSLTTFSVGTFGAVICPASSLPLVEPLIAGSPTRSTPLAIRTAYFPFGNGRIIRTCRRYSL